MALTIGFAGCAGGDAADPAARTVIAGSRAMNLVILPLNVTRPMPKKIESSAGLVWEEVQAYLEAQGGALKSVAFPTARRLWLESIQAAKAGGRRASFDAAAGILASQIGEHTEYDTLVILTLFEQQAPIQERTAEWDGVTRDLVIETQGGGAGELPEAGMTGYAPAISLHAAVFSASGEKIHEGQGGIDLLVKLRLRWPSGTGGEPTAELVPREDALSDRDRVREGLAQSLDPFIAPSAGRAKRPD